jgi:hypothetical protein
MRISSLAILGILEVCPLAHAETKTVSWFLAHPDVRAKVLQLCRNNPGDARHNSDCINAADASQIAAADRMMGSKAPPLLIDQCAQMGTLFQTVYHCGPAESAKH